MVLWKTYYSGKAQGEIKRKKFRNAYVACNEQTYLKLRYYYSNMGLKSLIGYISLCFLALYDASFDSFGDVFAIINSIT